jgi:predicted transcriptional regulator
VEATLTVRLSVPGLDVTMTEEQFQRAAQRASRSDMAKKSLTAEDIDKDLSRLQKIEKMERRVSKLDVDIHNSNEHTKELKEERDGLLKNLRSIIRDEEQGDEPLPFEE